MPSSVQFVPSATWLAWQVPLPSQVSGWSQSELALEPQLAAAALKPFAGQEVCVPSQVSATSHSPAAARHTVPAFPAGCVHAGAPTVPLHTSVVHTMPSSVQLVPADLTVSEGQVDEPLCASAMSWPTVAFDALFEPVAPAAACNASALSALASLVPLEV